MSGVAGFITSSMANAPWPFLLDAYLKSAVVLLVALAATVMLRRASASVRHQIWSLALASILILPVLAAALPTLQIPLIPRAPAVDDLLSGLAQEVEPAPEPQPQPQRESQSQPQAEPQPQGLPKPEPLPQDDREAGAPIIGSTTGDSTSGDGGGSGWGFSTLPLGFWLLTIWAAVAALFLARLSLGALAASWISRNAEVVEDGEWKRLGRRVARQLGISTPVTLRRNERTGMPMAWGLFRPVVLLPADSKSWTSERRRVVLLHEFAHLKRRDCQTQILAQLACALHWFNPLVWVAARRLRAERERACDDLVLTAGTKGTDYAQHLLDIARSMRPADQVAWAAVSMAKPSQMEGRLMAILDSDRDRRSLTRVTSLSAMILVACLVLPLAALQPWASAEEMATAPAAGPGQEVHVQEANRLAEAAMEKLIAMAAEIGIELSSAEIEKLAEASLKHTLTANALRGYNLEALGEPGGAQLTERVFEAMIAALDDEDPEIREQAAYSLGQLEDSRAVEALIVALRDDVEAAVREQAAWSLGMIEDEAAVPALNGAIGDVDAGVREQAAWALGMIEDPAGVAGLAQAVNDSEAGVREQAVWALGMIEDEGAVPALSTALDDQEAGVREQAAWALGMIEAASAVPALNLALQDADPDVREQAAWALGMIEDASAVDALAAALANDAEPSVRQQAAWALGMIEDSSALEPLIDALENDVDKDVRETALWAIGMIAGDAWEDDADSGENAGVASGIR